MFMIYHIYNVDEEIINLPVKNIVDEDAILFLWCIDSYQF